MYYIRSSVRAIARGMGNLLDSCTIAGQRKRLDAAARHKKTDNHTPTDTVIEKKSCDTKEESCDLAVKERDVSAEPTKSDQNEANDNDQREAENDEREVQDVEPVEAKSEETEVSDDISNGSFVVIPDTSEQDTESHDRSHDSQEGREPLPEVEEPQQNGVHMENDEVGVVDTDGACARWGFPPVLDQFDLMDTETDPTELEAIFSDERLREIYLDVTQDGPRLGISIVGGQGSPSGDLPIVVKRVLPGSLAELDGRLKSGDELVAMNEKLLVGVSKDVAINVLSHLDGTIRLLVLQDV